MRFGEIDRGTWADVVRRGEQGACVASEFHQLPGGRETEERGAGLRAQVPADVMMLRNECFPKLLIVFRDEVERRRQAKIVAVVREQLHAKAVNGAEEGAVAFAAASRRRRDE